MAHEERRVTPVDVAIGRRLRSRRLEMGMSQEGLAALLGVTFQQVQKYERGVNRIAASRLYDIAAALDRPVNFFFEGLEPELRKPRSTKGEQRAEESQELLGYFASIDDERKRARVIELASDLAKPARGGAYPKRRRD